MWKLILIICTTNGCGGITDDFYQKDFCEAAGIEIQIALKPDRVRFKCVANRKS